MRKGLTIMMLAGTALFGVASAANAQDYRYQGSRFDNPARVTSPQYPVGGAYYRSQERATQPGNSSPPAAGEGRVNSDDQS